MIKELDKIPIPEWAKIYCSLNNWEIPESLLHIKPEWWDEEPSQEHTQKMISFVRPFMDKIKSIIGAKACNREWNRERMTDEQHEVFWKSELMPAFMKYET